MAQMHTNMITQIFPALPNGWGSKSDVIFSTSLAESVTMLA
jgi:hypothetical protein